ncbi:MAG: hypothetical protein ACFE9I_18855, partial [Candidatus Hermodarchaeota archaeon]
QDVLNEYLKYDQIATHVKFQPQSEETLDKLTQKLLQPSINNSQKYSIPILYINPMNYNSLWSKRLRKNGALLFKLWDRPVNALAKVCEYVEYQKKFYLTK